MFKIVNVRRRKIRIRIGDKEGSLQSYVVNSIRTNLHLIYVIDNRKCFYFTDETCPDFYSILSGLNLGNTTIQLLPQMAFKLDEYLYFTISLKLQKILIFFVYFL